MRSEEGTPVGLGIDVKAPEGERWDPILSVSDLDSDLDIVHSDDSKPELVTKQVWSRRLFELSSHQRPRLDIIIEAIKENKEKIAGSNNSIVSAVGAVGRAFGLPRLRNADGTSVEEYIASINPYDWNQNASLDDRANTFYDWLISYVMKTLSQIIQLEKATADAIAMLEKDTKRNIERIVEWKVNEVLRIETQKLQVLCELKDNKGQAVEPLEPENLANIVDTNLNAEIIAIEQKAVADTAAIEEQAAAEIAAARLHEETTVASQTEIKTREAKASFAVINKAMGYLDIIMLNMNIEGINPDEAITNCLYNYLTTVIQNRAGVYVEELQKKVTILQATMVKCGIDQHEDAAQRFDLLTVSPRDSTGMPPLSEISDQKEDSGLESSLEELNTDSHADLTWALVANSGRHCSLATLINPKYDPSIMQMDEYPIEVALSCLTETSMSNPDLFNYMMHSIEKINAKVLLGECSRNISVETLTTLVNAESYSQGLKQSWQEYVKCRGHFVEVCL